MHFDLKSIVALSTTKIEFIALIETIKEVKWLQGLLKDFGFTYDIVSIHCDNKSVIHLTKNP